MLILYLPPRNKLQEIFSLHIYPTPTEVQPINPPPLPLHHPAMLSPRPLIKGPLHPPKQQTNPSPTSYSQRAIARGELWLEKRPRNSGGKGVHTRFSYQNGLVFLDLLTSCCVRKEVTFDSGKLPRPFLNPAVMGQRTKQRAEREKKDQG